jgi:hypothetical protein
MYVVSGCNKLSNTWTYLVPKTKRQSVLVLS